LNQAELEQQLDEMMGDSDTVLELEVYQHESSSNDSASQSPMASPAATETPVASCSFVRPRSAVPEKRKVAEVSLRQKMKRAKWELLDTTDELAKSRLLEQRIKTISAAFEFRQRVGDMPDPTEIPDDLYDAMFVNMKKSF